MPKVLEDSLGNLEYLLLGLTFLGVLYLVMKQANLNVSVSKDQFVGNHGIRFLTEDDAGNRAGYYPKQKGYEGMSLSGYEPPVWHATAHDPSELDMVAFEHSAAGADYAGVIASEESKRWRSGEEARMHAAARTRDSSGWDTAGQEGMGGYARKAVESMDNKLTNAMLGGNAGLQ